MTKNASRHVFSYKGNHLKRIGFVFSDENGHIFCDWLVFYNGTNPFSTHEPYWIPCSAPSNKRNRPSGPVCPEQTSRPLLFFECFIQKNVGKKNEWHEKVAVRTQSIWKGASGTERKEAQQKVEIKPAGNRKQNQHRIRSWRESDPETIPSFFTGSCDAAMQSL